MEIKLYQVDAFTNELFRGNPAAVCLVDEYPRDDVMQSIAAENNLAETAFVRRVIEDQFFIRWFTPLTEVELCGHATLASAYVLFEHGAYKTRELVFDTLYSGLLKVIKDKDWYYLDFPADALEKVQLTKSLADALTIVPQAVYKGRTDYLVVYANQSQVESLHPDYIKLAELDARGIIATSRGKEVDFVSRFFAPAVGIDEDPVTGSAHTTLVPYWSKSLGKNSFLARQISNRGGFLRCELKSERVRIGGQAKLYMVGVIVI